MRQAPTHHMITPHTLQNRTPTLRTLSRLLFQILHIRLLLCSQWSVLSATDSQVAVPARRAHTAESECAARADLEFLELCRGCRGGGRGGGEGGAVGGEVEGCVLGCHGGG